MKTIVVSEFQVFVMACIDKNYYDNASLITLRSFHLFNVIKPENITVSLFNWLRSVAEKTIITYKNQQNGI